MSEAPIYLQNIYFRNGLFVVVFIHLKSLDTRFYIVGGHNVPIQT